jgi:hypothetical protein
VYLQNRLIFFNLLPGTNRSFATQERGHGASNQWGSGQLGIRVRHKTERGDRDEHDGGSPRAEDDGSGRFSKVNRGGAVWTVGGGAAMQ